MRIPFALLAIVLFQLEGAGQAWDLQKCIDYALANNLTVQQSELQIARAEESYNQNRYDLLPNLNSQVSYGFNFGQRIDPFTNQFANDRVATGNVFLSSNLDIFNAFSKRNAIRQSLEDMRATEMDVDNQKNDVALRICLSYLTILLNKENVGIAEQQVALSTSQVNRIRILVDAGAEPEGSFFDGDSQLAQEELTLVNAENALRISLLEMTQLLQLTPGQASTFDVVTPDLSDEGGEVLQNSAQDIYTRAQVAMPEIKAADYRRTSSLYAYQSAKGLLYPNLSLSGSVGSGYSGANSIQVGEGTNIGPLPIGQVFSTGQIVTTIDDQTFFSGNDFQTKKFGDQLNDNFNQNLQLNLQIPIFNGNSAKANVNRAKINQLDAELSYQQISNQLRFEVEQAYADAKAAMNSYVAAQRAVRSLEESFRYAEIRFEQQVINTVDFNNIKTQYTNAQASMARAKYDFVFRTKILDFYLGKAITL